MALLPLRYVHEQAGGRYPPALALGLVHGGLHVHAGIGRTPAVKPGELCLQHDWIRTSRPMGANNEVDLCLQGILQRHGRPKTRLTPGGISSARNVPKSAVPSSPA